MAGQVVWFGLIEGSIIAMGALGFTLIFGILNFFNVAYAEYLTFAAYFLFTGTQMFEIPFVAAVVIAIVLTGVLSWALDRGVFRFFRDRSPFTLLIVSIGVTYVMRASLRIAYGSPSRLVNFPVQMRFEVLGVRILLADLVIIGTTVVAAAGTFHIIHNTRVGIAMRAASENEDLVRIRGLDTERLIRYVVVLGGVLAGIAGVLAGFTTTVSPLTGFTLLIPIFAAVVLGGVGDPIGAILGGLSIGLVQELSTLWIDPGYKAAVALFIVVIGLLLKPEGIFGEATRV